MKNAINYFYNLNIDNLRMIDDDYYFYYGNRKFIFQKIKDMYFDYQATLELNRVLLENNKSFFQIMANRNNEVITTISNQRYILMVDNCMSDRNFNFHDVLDMNIPVNIDNKLINRLNRNNWTVMWKNKIDYFESFLNHNINKYLELNKYANYFIGLGETAISYVKDTLEEVKPSIQDHMVVSHKRINYNGLKQLYNPLHLVIDHQSRDIAEYFKILFLNNASNRIDSYISMINLSNYGARLLMGRMLFPSFFFDLFENLIEGKCIEETLLYLIDKMNYYETYLLRIYNILKTKYNMPEIKWLKKADYSSTLTTPNTSGTSFINIDSIPSLSVTSIMLQ